MLLMCFQSSRFIDNSSSCLHTMEIVFTHSVIAFAFQHFSLWICMQNFISPLACVCPLLLFFFILKHLHSLYLDMDSELVHIEELRFGRFIPSVRIFWTILLLFGVFSNMNGDLSQIQEHKTFQQFLGCDGLLISYQAVLSAWRCFWLLTLAWLTPLPSLNANSSVMGTASSFPLQFSHTIPA